MTMTSPITILMVDDEPASLRMFQRTFGGEFHVMTASSASDGMRVLERGPVDVILADQMMPVEKGASFLSKAKEKCPKAVLGIISAYTKPEDEMTMSGIANFFAKPYETEAMRQFLYNGGGDKADAKAAGAAQDAADVMQHAATEMQTVAEESQVIADDLRSAMHGTEAEKTTRTMIEEMEKMSSRELVAFAGEAVLAALKKTNERLTK